MANSKNQLPGLKQLANAKTKVPGIGSVASLESTPATGTFRPGRSRDTPLSSLTGKINATGLRFGGSSSSGTTSSGTGSSQWTNLLKQTASGGISSALGGGLKDIGGITSIVSGFINLFGGGKSAPPPLVHFEAPASQNQTAFVGSATGAAKWAESGTSAHGASSQGIYASGQEPNVQSLQYQSAQIAQAVKQALLNSSSLNDVIAEI
jgi:hypothetical protein